MRSPEYRLPHLPAPSRAWDSERRRCSHGSGSLAVTILRRTSSSGVWRQAKRPFPDRRLPSPGQWERHARRLHRRRALAKIGRGRARSASAWGR